MSILAGFPQWFSPSKTCVDVVPVGYVIFSFLPAEKDFAFVKNCREVDEAALHILQLNFARLKFTQQFMYATEVFCPFDYSPPSKIFTCGQTGFERFLGFVNTWGHLIEFRKPLAKFGEQFASLGQGIVPGILQRHQLASGKLFEHILNALLHVWFGVLDGRSFFKELTGFFRLLQFQVHFTEVKKNFSIIALGVF